MDYPSALSELGLNTNETQVYCFLLQNGTSYAPQIQTALELDKVPTYRALNALKSKGYVETIGETRNQQFIAEPLETLLHEYDERMQKLTRARQDIESLARTLSTQHQELYKDKKIKIFDGLEGYRLFNEERLRGNTETIREFGRPMFIEEFFTSDDVDEYMEAYIKRRLSKGIAIRVLTTDNEPRKSYDSTQSKLLKHVRVVDLPSDMDIFLSTFGTRFGFYTKQSGRYLGVIIDDPMLSSVITLLLDVMWETGREV